MSKPQAAFHTRIAQMAAIASGQRRLKAEDPADTPADDDAEYEDEDDGDAKPRKADDDNGRHATASGIIAAGKVRRGEVAATKPTGLAAKIIEAGRKRRGDT